MIDNKNFTTSNLTSKLNLQIAEEKMLLQILNTPFASMKNSNNNSGWICKQVSLKSTRR